MSYAPAQIGANLTAAPSTVPTHRPGDRAWNSFGVPHIYVQAHANITNGTRFNVLATSASTSANASGVWVNNTGVQANTGQYFWASLFLTTNIITS